MRVGHQTDSLAGGLCGGCHGLLCSCFSYIPYPFWIRGEFHSFCLAIFVLCFSIIFFSVPLFMIHAHVVAVNAKCFSQVRRSQKHCRPDCRCLECSLALIIISCISRIAKSKQETLVQTEACFTCIFETHRCCGLDTWPLSVREHYVSCCELLTTSARWSLAMVRSRRFCHNSGPHARRNKADGPYSALPCHAWIPCTHTAVKQASFREMHTLVESRSGKLDEISVVAFVACEVLCKIFGSRPCVILERP